MITADELADAWASGYWHGVSHEGPLNDGVVRAKNPFDDFMQINSDAGSPAKKNTGAATETPTKRSI